MNAGVDALFGRPERGTSSTLFRPRLNSKAYRCTVGNEGALTLSPFLYEFPLLINLPKQRILSLHDIRFFPLYKITLTRQLQMACKQTMN